MPRGKKKSYRRRKNRNKSDADIPRSSSNFMLSTIDNGNFAFELYYALQGLHDHHFVDNNNKHQLVPCNNEGDRQRERQNWRTCLGTTLPASFRLSRDAPEYYQTHLRNELQGILKEACDYEPTVEQSAVAAVHSDNDDEQKDASQQQQQQQQSTYEPLQFDSILKPLPFLPTAFQLGMDRPSIRRHPALTKLKEWMKEHAAAGHITRQETVSMIPPVLLQAQQSDDILDMCAAPGSKTTQLLEDMSNNHSSNTTSVGCLVANDANSQRAYLLVHQLKRILHHHPVALVTAASAQFFPSKLLQFDKILCDVPCSGDGTHRKNIMVWRNWTCASAISLHRLQLQIAKKGALELLKVGGTFCYSTCSQNPIENEAVVAELLRLSRGTLELVDVREQLGTFRTRPGMSGWKVVIESKSNRMLKNEAKKHNAKMQARRAEFAAKQSGSSKEEEDEPNGNNGDAASDGDRKADDSKPPPDNSGPEVAARTETAPTQPVKKKFEPESLDKSVLLELAAQNGLSNFESFETMPNNHKKRVVQSCFPPTPEEAERFQLEKCIRCLPHDNDTGGFFIAMLRKTAPWGRADRQSQEPDAKRAKVQDEDDNEKEACNDAEADFAEEEPEGLDGDNKPIRGQLKGNLVKGEEYGKDDFCEISTEILDPLIEYYGFANGFRKDLYMCRKCSDSKIVYYIHPSVKKLFDMGLQERTTIVNSGLKSFVRNSKNNEHIPVAHRVAQEGVHFLLPYMTKRVHDVGLADFKMCLSCTNQAMPLEDFSPEFRDEMKDVEPGSFVAVLKGYEDQMHQKLVATMWKCRGDKVDGLVGKGDIDVLKNKLAAMEAKAPSVLAS